jgi:predicted polyphosphate/ATP-dependent NAD kinase
MHRLKLGLIINPLAGIGGPAALKGSDGAKTVAAARAAGAVSQVVKRVTKALSPLLEVADEISWKTCSGPMGVSLLIDLGFPDIEVVCSVPGGFLGTSAADSRRAVQQLQAKSIDLLVFAGGDGTARDIYDASGPGLVVLGIPCGVKMHSSVFTRHLLGVAPLVLDLLGNRLLTAGVGEVRDIDEQAFRNGLVKTRYYGELPVLESLRYMQHTKVSGREVEALVVEEIAADFVDDMQADQTYFVGSGSTMARVMSSLNLTYTLLGVDVVRNRQLVQLDATEAQLYQLASTQPCTIAMTVIGGQGHLFGRGNQQFSARVIDAVGPQNIDILATKSKIEALEGEPFIVDTSDSDLDDKLTGLVKVRTGYEDAVFYRVVAQR